MSQLLQTNGESLLLKKIKKHKENNLKNGKVEVKDFIEEKQKRNVYATEEESKEGKKISKEKYRLANPDKVSKVQQKAYSGYKKKIRYLFEKHHDEVGMKVKKHNIIDPKTGEIIDPFMKDYMNKLRSNEASLQLRNTS